MFSNQTTSFIFIIGCLFCVRSMSTRAMAQEVFNFPVSKLGKQSNKTKEKRLQVISKPYKTMPLLVKYQKESKQGVIYFDIKQQHQHKIKIS